MSDSPSSHKETPRPFDVERQARADTVIEGYPKSLGAGSALGLGAFGTTLTTLSMSLMEWRGVSISNAFVANFFFISVFGLLITAQWELSVGNGFAYTVFSAFGLFYAGYGAILTPAFGIQQAYANNMTQYNNALGFFLILWTVFVFTFLVGSLASNLAYILVFLFVDLGFLFVAASYFVAADGYTSSSVKLQKAGGAFCFVAGLVGWYIVFHLFLKDSIVEIPLGDTSRYFARKRKA